MEPEIKENKTDEMKSVMKIGDKESFISELQKEMQDEYQTSVKSKVKQLMKEIYMTKELLKKQEKELEDMLSGNKEILPAEEYLFGR